MGSGGREHALPSLEQRIAFALALVPFWRYNNLDGRTTLLQIAGDAAGLDLARFLPSLRFPTGWTWVVLRWGGALLLAACWYWGRRRSPRVAGWGVGAILLAPGPAMALTVAIALSWMLLAATVPTWAVDGPAMRHSTGIQFGSHQSQEVVWVMTRPGEVSERVVTWPGVTEITIRAGGYTTIHGTPRMRLLLDETEVHTWQLAADREWIAGVHRPRPDQVRAAQAPARIHGPCRPAGRRGGPACMGRTHSAEAPPGGILVDAS